MQTYSRAPSATHTTWIAPSKKPTRQNYERYDWNGMREQAVTGQLPEPPVGFDNERRKLLAKILVAIETGDPKKVLNIKVKDYNSAVRSIGKYRDICVIALYSRAKQKALEAPSNPQLDIC